MIQRVPGSGKAMGVGGGCLLLFIITTDETEVRHQEKNLWNDLPHSRRPCNKEDASF